MRRALSIFATASAPSRVKCFIVKQFTLSPLEGGMGGGDEVYILKSSRRGDLLPSHGARTTGPYHESWEILRTCVGQSGYSRS